MCESINWCWSNLVLVGGGLGGVPQGPPQKGPFCPGGLGRLQPELKFCGGYLVSRTPSARTEVLRRIQGASRNFAAEIVDFESSSQVT